MTRARIIAALLGLLGAVICEFQASVQAAPPDDLLTVAEKSNFQATARHAEVVALCERLAARSPLVKLTEMGRSGEGRSLPLMVVADPPVSTPEQASGPPPMKCGVISCSFGSSLPEPPCNTTEVDY